MQHGHPEQTESAMDIDCNLDELQPIAACTTKSIDTMIDMQEKAELDYNTGNFADAIDQFYRAWKIGSRTFHEPNILTARAAQGLGMSYAGQRKFWMAYGWYEAALGEYCHLFGRKHDYYLDCKEAMVRVGNLLNDQYPQEPAKL